MLGGRAKGAVRKVIAGEFGKDVDSQKRVLGQFDPCGICWLPMSLSTKKSITSF